MELPPDLDRVLGPRDVVVVQGADARTYLHSQLSQAIDDLAVGEERWSFALDPTGKVLSLARVRCVADDRFELDTDAGHGADLLARLDRFKIRVDASTSLEPATPDDGGGGPPVDAGGSIEADRVALGWPRLGAEIVPGETIPAGTGLTRLAVSFTKGCYPGQELVERMDSRAAEAPRSLRRIEVGDGAAPGDPVLDGDDEVGVLTSVAGGRALGWVKRASDVGEVVQF
jgi:folate-binding protein YgfZ